MATILESIQSGLEFKDARQDRETLLQQRGQSADRQAQFQALLSQVFGGGQAKPTAQEQLLAGTAGAPGPQPTQQAQALTGQPQQMQVGSISALAQLASQFPEQFEQVNKNLGLIDQGRKDEAAQFAFELQNTPFDQRAAKLQARAQSLSSRGRNNSDTLELLDMTEEEQNQAAQVVQIAALTPEQRLEFAQGPKPTSLQQNLLAAGLQPGTPEFEQAVLTAVTKPATTVNVGAGEGTERKEIAKVRARQFEKLSESADNAEETISNLDQLDAIGADTGALEPAKAAIAAVIEGFGIDASGIADITTSQALTASSNRMINSVLNAAKGPQTEGDALRAKKTIRSLGDDPLAGQFKSNSLRALALRTIEQRDFIDQRIDAGDTFSKARAEWNKFKKNTPSLSAVIKNPQTKLPLFFYQFQQQARQKRPDITDEQIVQAWRNAHAKN